ncbi:MAG: DNA repair protein RadC [Erysipelotrichaceae bacterium]|nr:DNA repair protein RadC [Erysipelotrichaceae bacterium]
MSEKLMPREKALEYGISALDNDELLALIIKSAYRERNVMQLADDVIDMANGFNNLLSLTYEELTAIKGIKKAKALEIMAILEISKRLSKVERIAEPEMTSPEKVVEWLRFNLGYSNKEEFFVVYLNARSMVIKSEVMYKGNRNSAIIGIDEILRKAILLKAAAILVAHNHPSDNPTPSDADIELTSKLCQSCKMMGIPLLDHIIVSKSSYFSFKNYDMLK